MASLGGRILRGFTLGVGLHIMALAASMVLVSAGVLRAAPFAAIIMDARSGETLWEQNSDTRLHPASLTKMMTLYIAFQEIQAGRMSLDTMVTVSKNAAAQPPSRLGLRPGQKIAMRYLIRAAAIKSANDAASAIGDHIGGNQAEFAKRMTRTARALGMRNTTFKNANGLTVEGHLSTARDMNVLGRHLFYDFPQFYNIFSRRTADAGIAKVNNTNTRFLDAYEGADGIKTGYTVAAGFNLTASAKRGNKRIITTVFGGKSTAQRNAKMVELMNKGFDLSKNRVRERPPVAAPITQEPLIAAARGLAEDEPEAKGGVGKTVRVSGLIASSQRPRARPSASAAPVLVAEAPKVEVPDAVALAIAESVESALAEATAPPPAPDSFEAQALALNDAPASRPEPRPDNRMAEADPAIIEVPEQDSSRLPQTLTASAAPAPNSLEAQALALANGEARPAAAAGLVAQAEALENAAPEVSPALAALTGLRPMARPERAGAVDAPMMAAAAAPVLETVTPPALAAPRDEPMLAAVAPAPVARPVVAAEVVAQPEQVQLAALSPEVAPATAAVSTRRAPIFDPVAPQPEAVEMASADDDRVVVAKSTAGGRAWAVNVGAYTSQYEAQRSLLKTGLAESATLDQGLRKVTQSGGKYRASFMGLTQDEANLACRRLRARGMECSTNGPG